MFSSEISTLLPKLQDLLLMDGMSRESIQIMVGDILNTEKLIQKNHKITKFPGVRYEERLWYLIRLYCLASYLVLHFRRVLPRYQFRNATRGSGTINGMGCAEIHLGKGKQRKAGTVFLQSAV